LLSLSKRCHHTVEESLVGVLREIFLGKHTECFVIKVV